MIIMDARKFGSTILFRVDIGEELVESIREICKRFSVTLGYMTSGIGATNKATIGVYNLDKRVYYPTEISSFYEITNLSGNISTMNNQPYFHFHVTLGNPSAMAGHVVYNQQL